MPLIFVILLITFMRLGNQTDIRRDYISIIQDAEKWGISKDATKILKSRDFWLGILAGSIAVMTNFIPNIAEETDALPFGIFAFVIIGIVCFGANLLIWLIVYKLWRGSWRGTKQVSQQHSESILE